MHSTALVPVAAAPLPSPICWKPVQGKPGPATAGCQVHATQITTSDEGQPAERLLVLDVIGEDGDDVICIDAATIRQTHTYLSQRAISEGRRLQPAGEVRVPRVAVESVLAPSSTDTESAIGYLSTVTQVSDLDLIRSAACWAAKIAHAATYEGREFEEDEGDALLQAGLKLLLDHIGPHNQNLAVHIGDVDRDFYDAGFAARALGEEAKLRFSFDECLDSEGDSEHTHIVELPDCIVSMEVSLGHYSDENWDGSMLVEFGGGRDAVARERYVDECVLGCVNAVAERFASMIRQLDPRQRGLAIQQIGRLTRDLEVQMPAANDGEPTPAQLSA